MPRPVEVKIGLLEIDELCQMRADQNTEHAEALVAAYAAGESVPPISVFERTDTHALVVVDGFHRHWALVKGRARTALVVVVGKGSLDDARAAALGANATHGLNRTSADKRRAVALALAHPFAGDWSHADIAEKCRVSVDLVRDVRRELDERSASQAAREAAAARAQAAAAANPRASTRQIARAAGTSRRAASTALARVAPGSETTQEPPPPLAGPPTSGSTQSDPVCNDEGPPADRPPTAAMLAKAAGLPKGAPNPMPYLELVRSLDAWRREHGKRLDKVMPGARQRIDAAFAALRSAIDGTRPVPCPEGHAGAKCSACGGRGWVEQGRVEGLLKQKGPR